MDSNPRSPLCIGPGRRRLAHLADTQRTASTTANSTSTPSPVVLTLPNLEVVAPPWQLTWKPC
jgi:hypothetical protein